MKNSKILKIIILIIAIIAIIGSITLILNKSSKKELKPVEQIKTEEKSKNELKQENNEKETETVSKEDEKDSEESEETTEEKTEEKTEEESKTDDTTTKETKSEQSNSNSSSNNTTKETTTTTEENKSEQSSSNNEEDIFALVQEATLWQNQYLQNLNREKGNYDIPLDGFIAATPEKYKPYVSWQIATKYTYYKYTITDEADGSRTITKQGFMVDVLRYTPDVIATIGDISEYGITDEYLQTAPAGSYETEKIAHTIVY